MTEKLRSDLILLLAAAIWGFAFVAQRLGMDYVGPFTFTAVRFTLGCLVLLPVLYYKNFTAKTLRRKEDYIASSRLSGGKKTRSNKLILLQLLLGLLLFGGISFQQYGLQYTTAGNAGFITGFYVVLVPVAGVLIGHKHHLMLWTGVLFAITGLYFLMVTRNFTINKGDYYVAVCAVFWTFHVLLVGYVAPRTDAVKTALIQFGICAILSWFVAASWETIDLGAILNASWPLLYGGVLSVGIAYTLQVVAQQKAHPAYASIILSLESVFAVFGGWLILNEHFTSRALFGCFLMLSGMVAVQFRGK